MSDLMNIDSSRRTENDENLLDILLCGNRKFNAKTNQNISIVTLKLIKSSHKFDNWLFYGTCFPLELFSLLFHALYMTMY